MSRDDAKIIDAYFHPKDNGWTLVQECKECRFCTHDVFHVCPSCGARQGSAQRMSVARWVSTRRWWDLLFLYLLPRKGYWELRGEKDESR